MQPRSRLSCLPALLAVFVCLGGCSSADRACEVDADCPGPDQRCIDGVCKSTRCPEEPCEEGQLCIAGTCYAEDCPSRVCPGKGEVCVGQECAQEDCIGVECPPDQACAKGDCYPKDCETMECRGYGEVCIEGVDGEACVQRTCLEVECPQEQVCANGYCYPVACEDENCPDGQVCGEQGECVERYCANVVCPPGQRCANGRCWDQDCPGQACGDDEVCEDGQCTAAACVEGRCGCEPDEPLGEESCGDGRDNDCDELTDCADTFDCDGRACDDGDPATSPDVCQAGACVGAACTPDPGQENVETSCNDEVDNDCDGQVDCPDSDCTGQTRGCGDCGSQACQADGNWGECTGQGCHPGDTQSCGPCDEGTRTCSDSCVWGDCKGARDCTPGQTAPGMCGCGQGICTSSCYWDCDCGYGGTSGCEEDVTFTQPDCPTCSGPCLKTCQGTATCTYAGGGVCTYQNCEPNLSNCTFRFCL